MIRERVGELRGIPAPVTDELEPEAIGRATVGAWVRVVAVKLPIGLAPNLDR
jgi:hypothetical protein